MILEEFDENKKAKINPQMIIKKSPNFPEIVIACFSKKIVDDFVAKYNLEKIGGTYSLNGEIPIYLFEKENLRVAITMACLGASACVGHLEELIPQGVKVFIVFGTCGVLDRSIAHSQIILPTAAVRDEGTSYHYMVPTDEVTMPYRDSSFMKKTLSKKQIPFIEAKTWTTDALYRETEAKIKRRKEQGCAVVEMECSALLAWSQFREVQLYPFFFTADNLDAVEWGSRKEYRNNLHNALTVALELADEISKCG
ncbi:nucleoside phosphorylase [Enterococcus sp. LJL99]